MATENDLRRRVLIKRHKNWTQKQRSASTGSYNQSQINEIKVASGPSLFQIFQQMHLPWEIFDFDSDSQNYDELYQEYFEATPRVVGLTVYLGLLVITAFGHLRDFLENIGIDLYSRAKFADPLVKLGFHSLFSQKDTFYLRHIYRTAKLSFHRPICSCPGAVFDLMDRASDDGNWTIHFTGTVSHNVINMASYNYLGFGDNQGIINEASKNSVSTYGIGIGSSPQEMGNSQLTRQLDTLVASFLGVEAAITFPMGFATNSLNIPSLMGKGCLILSDELNHSSIVLGARLSGANIQTFKHGGRLIAFFKYIFNYLIVNCYYVCQKILLIWSTRFETL